MSSTAPTPQAPLGPTLRPLRRSRRGQLLQLAAAGALAVAANLILYVAGRGADLSMRVDPGVGAADHLVTAPDVAWKTALPLILGALAARLLSPRGRRPVVLLMWLGAGAAVITAIFAFLGAHDRGTGAVLVGMHLVTGAAFLVMATSARVIAGPR